MDITDKNARKRMKVVIKQAVAARVYQSSLNGINSPTTEREERFFARESRPEEKRRAVESSFFTAV